MTQTEERSPESATWARPASHPVVVVAWLVAAWCLGFTAVNIAFETTGHFADGPHAAYATGLSVMDWIVSCLKVLGAAVALSSVTQRRIPVSSRLLAELIWGAAALLGLYCIGSILEAITMLTGLGGNPDQLTRRSVAYLIFFLFAAAGYGVLAVSFSRRSLTGRRAALVGMLGGPLLLVTLLGAIPLLLVWVGLMPSYT
jgi:hypothetical protein